MFAGKPCNSLSRVKNQKDVNKLCGGTRPALTHLGGSSGGIATGKQLSPSKLKFAIDVNNIKC